MDRVGETPQQEDVRPKFIATVRGDLFTCLHKPAGAPPRDVLVVLCQSVGHEYERSHRALRRLAALLAASGFSCVRFDYSGMGDSWGDVSDAAPQMWAEDVRDVVQYARDATGASKVWMLGHRFGALFAACEAVAAGCDGLVLWNPVLNGDDGLSEWDVLECQHAKSLGYAADTEHSILGAELSPDWRAQLAAFALPNLEDLSAPRFVLAGEESAALAAQRQDLASHYVKDESGPIWRQEPLDAIVPFASLQRIVAWMSEAAS